MTTSRKVLLALAGVALAQTAVLAHMVIGRVQLLRNGQEITLPIVPVDPRDLFKGEYVRLSYDISVVSARALADLRSKRNDIVYVVIEKKDGSSWQPGELSRSIPGQPGSDRVVIKGRSNIDTTVPYYWGIGSRFPLVRYGIESYYVPQGEGPKLEAAARDRKLAALIAIDERGNAAIKGLIIDGELQYEERLF